MEGLVLIVVTIFIVASLSVGIVLSVIQNKKNKNIKKTLDKLEVEKNVIDSTPIMPELAKLEGYLKNDKINNNFYPTKDGHISIGKKIIDIVDDKILNKN